MHEIQIEIWPPKHFIVNIGAERHPDLDFIRRQFIANYGCPEILSRMAKEITTKDGLIETIEGEHPIVWGRQAIHEKEQERMIFSEWEKDHP